MKLITLTFVFFLTFSQAGFADNGTSAVGEVVDDVIEATGDAVEKQVDKEIEKRTGYSRSDEDDEGGHKKGKDKDKSKKDKDKKKDKKDKKDKKKDNQQGDANEHGKETSAVAKEDGREYGEARSEFAREENNRDSDDPENKETKKGWWEFWK